jgi:SAM-dependent methyltransferase
VVPVAWRPSSLASLRTPFARGIHSPNTVMEEPALLEAIGDLDDADLLDLGCGDGNFAVVALERGARSYLGLDASPSMIDAARRTVAGKRVSFECMAIEDFDAGGAAYDVVTAPMALHYVADLADALGRIHRSLRDGGRFVCTVVHPVITSHDNPRSGPRSDWTVDRYFDDGPRQRQWFGKEVTWYHRTIEQYVCELTEAGFRFDALSECAPAPQLLADHPEELLRRRRVPLILLLGGARPGTPPLPTPSYDLAQSATAGR